MDLAKDRKVNNNLPLNRLEVYYLFVVRDVFAQDKIPFPNPDIPFFY